MRSSAAGMNTADGLTERLEELPLTSLHLLVLLVCGLGFSFDLAELAFGNILSAVFSAPPYAASGLELGWLLAAVYIGAIVGAPLLGWLADRVGRRLVLVGLMAFLGLVSILTALAPDIRALILSRALGGLALGAYPPLMFAYLTDILPPRRRGGLIVASTAIGYIGPPAFIFLVRWLTPIKPFGLEAWRFGFLAAAAGAILCAILFSLLPESPRWLIRRGRLPQASAALDRYQASRAVGSAGGASPSDTEASKAAASDRRYRGLAREAAVLVGLYFLTPWATVGFTVLSGAVLVQKGINVQDSLLYVGVSTFGPIIGTLAAGLFVDRFPRRSFLIGCAVAMGIVGIAFALAEQPVALMASGLAFNLVVSLFLPILVLFAAEAVPSESRARVTSWAWASNRIGSALTPLALLPLLRTYGPVTMFVAVGATLLVFIVVLWIDGRSASGRPASER